MNNAFFLNLYKYYLNSLFIFIFRFTTEFIIRTAEFERAQRAVESLLAAQRTEIQLEVDSGLQQIRHYVNGLRNEIDSLTYRLDRGKSPSSALTALSSPGHNQPRIREFCCTQSQRCAKKPPTTVHIDTLLLVGSSRVECAAAASIR